MSGPTTSWPGPSTRTTTLVSFKKYIHIEYCKSDHTIVGFVLDEVMNKLQDFCWISNAKEQVSMLSKFCDKYFEINASHCSKVSYLIITIL